VPFLLSILKKSKTSLCDETSTVNMKTLETTIQYHLMYNKENGRR